MYYNDISWAMKEIRLGGKVTRRSWNNNSFIKLAGDEIVVYLAIKRTWDTWHPLHSDLLAEDWEIAK